MGMSASQVRFLSLQSRKNSIGKQLLTLSNRKMALSRDMNAVALKFNNALNQTVLKWSNDSGSNYNTLTYDLMMRPNDLNTEKPYIVTKASTGEVVLNDDVITVGGEKLTKDDGSVVNLSYVDIAKMISSYSGMKSDGTCLFNNTKSLSTTDGVITGGSKAIDNAYYIPNGTYDYSFDNSLRYTLFTELGLISETDKAKQLELLNKLYGSEEAQKSGVYPVDCAWGKYYIACANLEAYENYTKNYHMYADANTFSGTAKTSESETYSNSIYDYSYDIQGTDSGARANSNTQIKQKAYSTGATSTLSHIDFTSATSAITNSHTSLNGTTYTSTLTNNGIVYQYSVDDIWENAKQKFQTNGGSLTDDITAVNAGADTSLREVASSGSSKLDLSGVKDKLKGYIDNFITVLKNNSIVNLNSSILEQAKNQTADYFYDNKDGGYDGRSGMHSGSKKAANKAKGRARNQNRIGYSRYGGIHSASRAYVDISTLFNTFMTYYSQLSAGQNTDTIATNGAPEIAFNDTSTEGAEMPTDSTSTSMHSGVWYYNETYHDTANNSYMTVGSKLTTTKPENYDSSGYPVFVYDSTTSSMKTYTGTETGTKYYIAYTLTTSTDEDGIETIEDRPDQEILTYNTSGTIWDEDNDVSTANKTIYGTVTKGNEIYYFETIDALNAYKTDGTLPSTKYTSRSLGASTSDIVLTTSKSTSKYGISISGTPKEDTDMQSYLKDKVNDAYDYVLELQDEIDNLYSSADQKLMDYFDALFQRIAENGWTVDNKTSSTNTNSAKYLNNKLQNNDYFVTECSEKADESGYNYTSKMATSIKKIYSVHDDNAENEALAEYEEEKSAITLKEEKIDVIMQKLETEQESVNTMMESVQKVIKENIDKTFKMFA